MCRATSEGRNILRHSAIRRRPLGRACSLRTSARAGPRPGPHWLSPRAQGRLRCGSIRPPLSASASRGSSVCCECFVTPCHPCTRADHCSRIIAYENWGDVAVTELRLTAGQSGSEQMRHAEMFQRHDATLLGWYEPRATPVRWISAVKAQLPGSCGAISQLLSWLGDRSVPLIRPTHRSRRSPRSRLRAPTCAALLCCRVCYKKRRWRWKA